MNSYEVVLIVHPDMDDTALTGVIDRVKGWIVESGGSVAKVDLWGKRRISHAIKKQREGHYVLLESEFKPTFSSELERNLRLTEPILRFLIKAV